MNFYVMVIDFESKDIDMVKVFNIFLFSSRYNIILLIGKFYKIFVLNKVVQFVFYVYDIIFLIDFYVDVLVDIMDSVCMVRILYIDVVEYI